ncbi:MAG: histidinol-phosphate transaminase [Clostridia bacterium]|nr:histidinol-phosphate transaminase [Clostridia bacterium]
MSRFFSKKFGGLTPYTPGEQPKDKTKYIKLNTNESPFPPSPLAQRYAAEAIAKTMLYSDPECFELRGRLAETYGVGPENVICGNGSDDILNFAFSAFCDGGTPAVFADITYGFYPVFAEYNRVPSRIIPLKDDFTIDPADYYNAAGTVFIANPNAPTGIALTVEEIGRIVKNNPDNIVVVDEAYVDFGAASCVPLTKKYGNLIVTQTFSKSRSLAGARLGYAIADRALISDLNTVKDSTNPYNVNAITQAAGVGALEDREYTEQNCKKIMQTRQKTVKALNGLGFVTTRSSANFIFAAHPRLSGEAVYRELKASGVLVRHFSAPRIKDYNRITVGTDEQMETLISKLRCII